MQYLLVDVGSYYSLNLVMASYKIASLVVVIGMLTEASCSCSRQEKMDYVHNNLEPECRNVVALVALDKDPELNGLDFALACTSSCLGKYTSWLLAGCNDTFAAHLAQVACLESTDVRTNAISRCRQFFPDVAHDLVFVDTNPCGPFLSSDRINCVSGCSVPLNNLINTIGCCFQSIYNDSSVITSLAEEGFLAQSQHAVLTLFMMSDLLDTCREGAIPEACSGQPFTTVSGTDNGVRSDATESPGETTKRSGITAVNSAVTSSAMTIPQLVAAIMIMSHF